MIGVDCAIPMGCIGFAINTLHLEVKRGK